MSQRQLALQSGVNHSTISRLIKQDRMPSLRTATKLSRALGDIHDEADAQAYFASILAPSSRPRASNTRCVVMTPSIEADVRELMQAYITVRSRRTRTETAA